MLLVFSKNSIKNMYVLQRRSVVADIEYDNNGLWLECNKNIREYNANDISISDDPFNKLAHMLPDFSFVQLYKGKIQLGRSESGVNPIYYNETDSQLIISNSVWEITKLLNHPSFSVFGVLQFVYYEYPKDPYTLIENVFAVERGVQLEFAVNKPIKSINFREPLGNIDEVFLSETEVIRNFKEKVIRAHERRLTNHNGIYLSGGIDSSVSSIVLKNYLDIDDLFAITFRVIGAEQDESKDAMECARQLDIEHNVIDVDPNEEIGSDEILGESSFPYVGSFLLNKVGSMLNSIGRKELNIFACQDTRLHTPSLNIIDLCYIKYLRNMSAVRKFIAGGATLIDGISENRKINRLLLLLKSGQDVASYIHDSKFHYHYESDIDSELIKLHREQLIEKIQKELSSNYSLRKIYNSIVDISWGWQYTSDIEYMASNTIKYGNNCSFPFYDCELNIFAASIPMKFATQYTKGRAGHSAKPKRVNKYVLRRAFDKELSDSLVYRDKAVCITNHMFLNGSMLGLYNEMITNPAIKDSKVYEIVGLSKLMSMAKEKFGKWQMQDYRDMVCVQNLIYLDAIARKYRVN